jgi:hypothetical protein
MALTAVASAAAAPVLHAAQGAGQFMAPHGVRAFSFSARQMADGSVRGGAHLTIPGIDFVADMSIDCLRVDGNAAVMSGRFERANEPYSGLVGNPLIFAVIDNGSGGKPAPDVMTAVLDAPAFAPPFTEEQEPVPTCDEADIAALFGGFTVPTDQVNVGVR